MTCADPDNLANLAARVRATPSRARRKLIAIAGAPASGKSTLAADLVHLLGDTAALVPMDGFHLDNRILDARGLRARKGAPQTYDSEGFVHMVRRLGSDAEVIVPVFDRSRDIAIAGAQAVTALTDIVIVEGNYLLLNAAPWDALQSLWDLTVLLEVPEAVLAERLIQRWRDHGLNAADAEIRAMSNDLPNALVVQRESFAADVTL